MIEVMENHEFEFMDDTSVYLCHLVVKDIDENSESYLEIEQKNCDESICLTFSDVVAMAKELGVTGNDLREVA